MSGLVTETNQKGKTSGLTQGFTFHRFTSTYSNWPKPYGCTMLVIEAIGGGGAGGGGSDNHQDGGGGGGGGALARLSFPAESLGETLTVTVGAVAAGGAGGDGADGGDGTAGNFSAVTDDDSSKVIIKAWGGGG